MQHLHKLLSGGFRRTCAKITQGLEPVFHRDSVSDVVAIKIQDHCIKNVVAAPHQDPWRGEGHSGPHASARQALIVYKASDLAVAIHNT